MNIAELIDENVKKMPDKQALYFPTGGRVYSSLTYSELSARAEKVADGLFKMGVRVGTKVLLFVRPSLEFPVISYALFKIGAVAILIDPGMGRQNLFKSIANVEPEVLIAVGDVFLGRKLYPGVFKSVKTFIMINQGSFLKNTVAKYTNSDAHCFEKIEKSGVIGFKTEKVGEDQLAAIVFTSGGTGVPKGVEYSHGIYVHQVALLQSTYDLTPDDIDLPAFPLFALFSLAMGMSVVIPDMDPTKPALACPKRLIEHIERKGVTFAGGSPAIWERVGRHCVENNLTLPTLRALMMFGAPVAAKIHQDFSAVLTQGTTYTPYGATECLPVSTISGAELLAGGLADLTANGKGTCIGQPSAQTEVKIIAHTHHAIESIDDVKHLAVGEIGEIIVKGKQATRQYHKMQHKTDQAKIADGQSFWHRMGDLGYLDEKGRLWFCGRGVHSIAYKGETLYSVMCEAHFNSLPGVKRTALVNSGSALSPEPSIVIESSGRRFARKHIEGVIGKLQNTNIGSSIGALYLADSFPVDIRHNIKIDRKLLGERARKGMLTRIF